MEKFEMEDKKLITCVYCGHEYPNETPTHGAQILKDHIKVCKKHPMREVEETIRLLRSALVGLVGSDNPDELKEMEMALRILPAPEEDKANSINAIRTLINTISYGENSGANKHYDSGSTSGTEGYNPTLGDSDKSSSSGKDGYHPDLFSTQ
jgi:hypothetical protein